MELWASDPMGWVEGMIHLRWRFCFRSLPFSGLAFRLRPDDVRGATQAAHLSPRITGRNSINRMNSSINGTG